MHGVFHTFQQLEAPIFQLQVVRFDAAEIEHIIDDRQQQSKRIAQPSEIE